MAAPLLPAQSPRLTRSRPPLPRLGGNGWAWLLALAAIWLWIWRYLATEWQLNEQYNFGFAVPFLAGWIGWRRWRSAYEAREAAPPRSTASRPEPGRTISSLAVGGLVLAWLSLFLAELLRVQDPTWRLIGWLMTGAATILTGAFFGQLGGVNLLARMAFAVGFAWFALPWPSPLENRVTLGLMRLVTATIVNVLNWSGVPALEHGNVIELSRGLVGVDTACSGVQSFQAILMTTVFLGELYALRWPRRLGLVFIGWGLAFLGNLVRVLLLTRSVERTGALGIEQYHDLAGYVTIAATFLCVWLVAAQFSRRQNAGPRPPVDPLDQSAAPGLRKNGEGPDGRGGTGRIDGYVLLLAVLLIPWLARGWFLAVPGRKTISIQSSARWVLSKSELARGWSAADVTFAPAERAVLRFSHGEGLWVSSPSGWTAQVLHFFWKPGAQVPSLAFSHTPDICMPSAGWTQVSPATPVVVQVRGSALPCLLYRFRLGRREQAVFHTIWYGGQPEPLGDPGWTGAQRTSRLSALWSGPFRRGHEVVTLFLPSTGTRESQVRLAQEILQRVLTPVGAN